MDTTAQWYGPRESEGRREAHEFAIYHQRGTSGLALPVTAKYPSSRLLQLRQKYTVYPPSYTFPSSGNGRAFYSLASPSPLRHYPLILVLPSPTIILPNRMACLIWYMGVYIAEEYGRFPGFSVIAHIRNPHVRILWQFVRSRSSTKQGERQMTARGFPCSGV